MIVRLSHRFLALFAVSLFAIPSLAALGDTPAASPNRVAAIFVENRGGPALADQSGPFEALLASLLTTDGFSIISRDTALNALASSTPGGPPTPADQLLATQTSALRLAQSLNANYVLVATLLSYGSDTRAFQGYGINTVNRVYTLRASYRLCDATNGGTLAGDAIAATTTVPQTANFAENSGDLLNNLLNSAAGQIADSFLGKVGISTLPMSAAPGQAPFSVQCSMADIVLPDILESSDNQYVIRPLAYTVEPLDVTVELNGLTLGSAPGNFIGPTGISKLRLSRAGFKPQDMTVNLSPGFNLNVALQMDDQGYARWQQSIAYLQGLKTDAQISAADADRIRGIAQMFRQSGLRLDQTSNISITGNQTPVIQQVYQSLLSAPPPVFGVPATTAAPATPAQP
jgi:hypothetical protein